MVPTVQAAPCPTCSDCLPGLFSTHALFSRLSLRRSAIVAGGVGALNIAGCFRDSARSRQAPPAGHGLSSPSPAGFARFAGPVGGSKAEARRMAVAWCVAGCMEQACDVRLVY
eukprot:2519972-Prymnesium_polylepis.1